MPRKVKVVNTHDDSTYGDITEAVVENEKAENETNEDHNTEEVGEPEPPKPKARAKRVSKPKAVRKPRLKKEEPKQELKIVVPAFPPRLARTAAREALYHSLASGGLSYNALKIK